MVCSRCFLGSDGNADYSVDNVLSDYFQSWHVAVDEASRGGVVDSISAQIPMLMAPCEGSQCLGFEDVVCDDIDPLDHGSQDVRLDVVGNLEVLVGVDADGPHVLTCGIRVVPGGVEDPDLLPPAGVWMTSIPLWYSPVAIS